MDDGFERGLRYASWGRRAGAVVLDGIIVAVVFGVLVGVLWALVGDAGIAIGYLLGLVGQLAYFTYFHGSDPGATPGKRALGIAVRRDDGSVLGYGRALARYAIQIVFGLLVIVPLLDYLWPLWDARNQSLHDKVAGSVVVDA